jgi:hypothetical protein
MNMALKPQARKELMEAMAAAEGLGEKLTRLGDDLREGRIDRKEAMALNKTYGAAVKRLMEAIRKAVDL